MSRNSTRRGPAPQTPTPAASPPSFNQNAASNPFGISFVVPTEVVELPSRGKHYQESSSLFGKAELEIKQMTAKEEEILSNLSFVEDGSMIDRLISSILIDKSVQSKDLMSADKNALIFAARRASYGPDYAVVQYCEGCKSEQQFVYDLSKCTINEEVPEGVVEESEGVFTFDLPQTKLTVSLRVLLPEDEQYLEEQNALSKKHNVGTSETINFLRRVIISVDGQTDQKLLGKLYEVLPVLDIRKIKSISKKISPTLDTHQEITCGSCGHATEGEVPFSLGFFWPDL